MDLAAVPRPESLIVFARLSKPSEALGIVGGWTALPMPGAEAAGSLLAGESVGKAIDLTQSIDLAVAVPPSGTSMRPMIAVSAGVRSLEDAKAQLSDKFTLVPGDNGALRIVAKSGGDEDDDRPCALVPSFGRAATRLICADGAGSMQALAPYLARTAPREVTSSDVHAEIRLAPVRPLVQQFRGFLPGLVTGMMNTRMDGAAELIEAAAGDAADLSMDLDTLAIDVAVREPAADATVTATFGATTSLLARLAVAHPERADAPPAAFWHLPVDADIAHYHRGLDSKDVDRPRQLLGNFFVAALEKEGLPDGDRKALADATLHYLNLFSGPIVYGKGIDAPAVARTVAAAHAGKGDDAAKAEADRLAIEQLAGWSVTQVDDPIAKVAPIARVWVAAMARPGVTKWMNKTHATGLPTLKQGAVPKTTSLPDGTLHLVATVPRVVGGAPDDELQPPVAAPGSAKKSGGAKAKPRALGKPLVVHVFVVPDGAHTWIAYAGDEALVVSKARAVLASAPDAGTLAKRAGLEALRDGRANAAGFVSARGLLSASPLRAAMGSQELPKAALFDALRATPGLGAVAIPYSLRAEGAQGGGAGSLVITAKVPRAAIQDVVKAGIESGKF